MRRGIVAGLLAVALAAGWYFGSPWWTLWRMKTAAEAHDARALSAHIDFPAVRESLKVQLRDRAGRLRVGGDPSLGKVVGPLAGALAGGLAEAAVRPEALGAMFLAAPVAQPLFGRIRAKEMRASYEGLDRFRLVATDGSGAAIEFRREWLWWKLAAITLPSKPR
ncbi:DUF2939 domain-containing protein [Sphingomonas canadensis]|uniref:DUF2939 domain-containing protein n=1 Tax=Sphingomonas canadensis TaxID=1219257 RepID=A0ABW3HAH4_9SPHN|nr:DUF2939 domain-containing protein [Sphingomonas canadensis]MCW3837944.1 DUF2939 domain-containing protein [Sphingomonas canadensis]